jgi:hypothetical protein
MNLENSPVFLFSFHRSGGTLLARILNLHPDIVIWGEHAGILNKLAELNDIIAAHPILERPLKERRLNQLLDKHHPRRDFTPWASPLEGNEFRNWCRDFILRTFTRGLWPGQRWGCKEIRYHSVPTARFILSLFPNARFILLRRDLLQLCVSNVMAEWSLRHLALMGADRSESDATQAVQDCAYALAAIEADFASVQRAFPAQSLVVDYADLVSDADATARNVFEFADLAHYDDLLPAVRSMLETRSGETRHDRSQGSLSSELIRSVAPQALTDARNQITREGIDLQRLRSKTGPGRFSFLVGDHSVRGSPHSTVF